jgi:ribosomal protein S6
MFLVDTRLSSQRDQVKEVIDRLMSRADAELLYCKEWDDRRLAYDIGGMNRGVYILTFFKAAPDRIPALERDVRLVDGIARALVLRQETLSEEKIRELAEGEGIVAIRLPPDRPYGFRGGAGEGDDAPYPRHDRPARVAVAPDVADGDRVEETSDESENE